jgi:hypothetical protein
MKYWLPVVTALIVGILGITGQFFISRRNHIVSVRDERAQAYGNFLSAALLGIRSVVAMRQYSDALRSGVGVINLEESKHLRQINLDAATLYETKISDSLSFLHLFAPPNVRMLGDRFNRAMTDFLTHEIEAEELNSTYSAIALAGYQDLESLRLQSQGIKAFFTSNFKEINLEI